MAGGAINKLFRAVGFSKPNIVFTKIPDIMDKRPAQIIAETTKLQTLNYTGLETIKLFNQVKAIDNLAGTAGHEEWPKAKLAAEADRFKL